MTSLEKSIQHIIKINTTQNYITVEQSEPFSYLLTHKIIDEIEKRIDSILKEEPHNTIDYAEGFARALMKVKEMLK